MEKRRLMVFENMVLWRIFGYKWDEVTREWRKLHNEGPTVLYSPAKYYSGNEIEMNEMGVLCSTNGLEERCAQGLVGKPEGKRPLLKTQA